MQIEIKSKLGTFGLISLSSSGILLGRLPRLSVNFGDAFLRINMADLRRDMIGRVTANEMEEMIGS